MTAAAVLDETVGERLRRLRLEQGFSQRELSSRGASYAYISRIEAGTRTPSVKALRSIAPKLGVTVDYLETGVDQFCVAVPTLAADVMLRDGTRGRDGDDFGLDELTEEERGLLDHELESALLHAVRNVGFALRSLRETGATGG